MKSRAKTTNRRLIQLHAGGLPISFFSPFFSPSPSSFCISSLHRRRAHHPALDSLPSPSASHPPLFSTLHHISTLLFAVAKKTGNDRTDYYNRILYLGNSNSGKFSISICEKKNSISLQLLNHTLPDKQNQLGQFSSIESNSPSSFIVIIIIIPHREVSDPPPPDSHALEVPIEGPN